MTKKRVRRLSIALPALGLALAAFVGEAGAGSPLIWMPPVGAAARPPAPPATGTITTPVTPTVPRAPVPGRSTITIPGVSGSGLASILNSATARPCGGGANAAGAVRGNAGIVTAPPSNPNNTATGVPNLPSIATPDAGATTINPSITPGVPSAC